MDLRLKELNKIISLIRKNTKLNALLTSMIDHCCEFLGGDGGFVLVIDDEQKVIKFELKGMNLIINKTKYEHHPIDMIPKKCELFTKKTDYYLQNTLSDNDSTTKSIFTTYFDPKPFSVIAVPMYDGKSSIIGVLSITSVKEYQFSEDHISLLKILGEQTGATIEKVLIIDEIDKIADISQYLLNYDFSYDILVNKIKDIYEAQGCSIFLKNEKDKRRVYVLKATTGVDGFDKDQYDDAFYEDGEGLTGYIAKEFKCLRIYNLANREEIALKAPGLQRTGPKIKENELFIGDKIHSFLGCCLISSGDAIGVIRLTKTEPANYFSGHDERSIEIIARYIAQRLRLDEQLAQLEAEKELNFLNQQILQFAHDANQTFGGLTDYLRTVIDWVPKQVKQAPGNKNFLDEVMNLKNLTKLYISKLSAIPYYSSELHIERNVKLKQLVEEIISMFSRKLMKEGITCNLSIPKDMTLDCDTDKIQQVFLNLLANSVKAMEKLGKTITIRANQKLDDEVTYLVIEFENDGPAIPDEYRDKIFEKHFSLRRGTGLGLAIAKSIIEAHKGKIKALFRLKTGACFEITIPQKYLK